MRTIYTDITKPGITEPLQVKRGDTQSRFFKLIVTDNGTAFSPPAGAKYSIKFENKLNSGWYDTIELPDGSTRAAINVNGNEITCEIAEAATWGDGKLSVIVYTDTGYQLALWDIVIKADYVPGDGAGETKSYYNMQIKDFLESIALKGVTVAIDGTTLVFKIEG